MALWLRWLILTGAILMAAYLLDNIRVANFLAAFLAAAALGILNAVLRPLILLLTLPLNIVTFGLFTFIINALMLKLVSLIIPGFDVVGFWAAFFGALMITLVNWILEMVITNKTKKRADSDVIDLQKKGKNRWG